MRAVALCSTPPFPPDTPMRQRTWNLLRTLDAERLTVVTWATPETDPAALAELRGHVDDLVLLEWHGAPNLSVAARARRAGAFLSGGLPPYVQAVLEERGLTTKAGAAHFADRMARACEGADVLLVAEESMACTPLPELAVPVALHRHNVFSRAIGDHVAHTGKRRLRWGVERRRWEAFDRRVTAAADLVFTPTPESAAELRALSPAADPIPLTSGVDVRALEGDPGEATDLVFVGWMSYPPNVEAVQWFVENCWPDVRASFPAATFRIVGRDPAPSVQSLAGDGVVVTGEVDDVVAACEGARVGVVPLHHGFGIKTKTLELMAMGLPVVATPTGAEGIAAGPEEGLWTSADAGATTAHVGRLLADADLARRAGRAARHHVVSHHTWEAVGAEHRRHLDGLLALTAGEARP